MMCSEHYDEGALGANQCLSTAVLHAKSSLILSKHVQRSHANGVLPLQHASCTVHRPLQHTVIRSSQDVAHKQQRILRLLRQRTLRGERRERPRYGCSKRDVMIMPDRVISRSPLPDRDSASSGCKYHVFVALDVC